MKTFGQAFGETIISGKVRQARKIVEKEADFRGRLFIFNLSFLLLFTVIFIRLFNLTVVKGEYYQKLSSGNRVKEHIFPAPRGIITDRAGEILVGNKPGYIARLPCGKQECYKKITHDEALKYEAEGKVDLLNLEIAREYTDSMAFSHILGITGVVEEGEIGTTHCGRKLTYEDELGRSGVEEAFDCDLQGRFGKELIETDASGKPLRLLSKLEPAPGKSLALSIDKNLQLRANTLMEGKKGVIVVHIPGTGEILVLYSAPSYDISKFVEGLSEGEYSKLVKDPDKPLFNRAVSGTYPPGSTFKTIVAASALEEKAIDKTTQIEDTGILTVGEFSFANWYFSQYGKTDGLVDIVTAVKRSNDIFFYKAGELLGVNKMANWARKFRLGQKLGIEIAGEEQGLVPDEKWKQEVLNQQWYLGDTYHYAIGQGNILVTPLQIAFANGAFANGGIICRPTVVKTDRCSRITEKFVSSQTLKLIKQGMIEACSPGGTGFPFFDYKVGEREIKVACKTGTAEFDPPAPPKAGPAGGDNRTHAWFTAFAPADNPQIAVTVLVEGGGEGSREAAPIAKELFNEWFTR